MRMRVALLALLVAVLGSPLVGADRAAATLGTGTMEDGVYGPNPPTGNGLRYKVYTPNPRPPGPIPLVVFLHGCTQDAAGAAASTYFNETADERGFAVVYPDQDASPNGSFSGTSNGSGCWNWFNPSQQGRGTGGVNNAPTTEPDAIAGITRKVMTAKNIDPRRVYVVGISAGADMATILGATYPDLFAAIASFAGCAYKTCADVTGQLARDAMTPARERQMPVFIGQGTNDHLNSYPLSEGLLHQWLGTNDLIDNGMLDLSVPREPAEVVHNGLDQSLIDDVGTLGDPCPTVPNSKWPCAGALLGLDEDDDYPTTIRYYDDANGNPLIEYWTIWGLSHAYPGGDPTQEWTDQIGPNPNVHLYNFFMAHPMPAPELSINDISVTETDAGEVDATFTVTRAGVPGLPVTVDVTTADVSATAGSDYTAISTPMTLSFAPSDLTETVTVKVQPDALDEIDETFTATLSNVSPNAVIVDDTGIGTILDNDAAPTLSIGDASVTEGDSGDVDATFNVSLSAASGKSVGVDVATQGGDATAGADYTSNSVDDLTFAAGEVTKPFTVKVSGDTVDEPDETFNVKLTGPVNATLLDDTGVGTILDDDDLPLPSLSISDVSVGETGTATFTVSLSEPAAGTVHVDADTSDGTAASGADYQQRSSTVTFESGQTTETFAVAILSDDLDEDDEFFNVDLSDADGATIADPQGQATITDDDEVPSLKIENTSVEEGSSGPNAVTVDVTLKTASGREVTVDFATRDGSATAGSDYFSDAGTVTFAPGEASKEIAITVIGDAIKEKAENLYVDLSAPVNTTITHPTGKVILRNDD